MLNNKKAIKLARFSILCLVVLVFCLNAKLSKSERERVESAVDVVNQLMGTPDKSIPNEVLDKCECIAVIPSVKKAAFVFGGQYGKGLVSCRSKNDAGWTAPVFFSLEGGSFGFQIGGQSIDLVLVIMNNKGVDTLLKDKFTLGADA